jgi:hypothetical protein
LCELENHTSGYRREQGGGIVLYFLLFFILFTISNEHPPLDIFIADDDDNTDDNGNMTNNGNANDGNEVDKNEPPTMAKGKKNKATTTATKKAGNKTTGDNDIEVGTPLSKKAKQRAATRAAAYFSTTALKGYTVNPYSRGSKNRIDVVFHDGSVPSKSKELVISLDHRGKALCVEWMLPEKLFMDLQATAQGMLKDSAHFNGYGHTQDHMHQAGVHSVEKCYQPVPQVLPLNQECTSNLVTMRLDVPTNVFVEFKGRKH